jgi:hypothetical protein
VPGASTGGSARERIIAGADGNPLALTQLPKGLSSAQPAGGYALVGTMPELSWMYGYPFALRLMVLFGAILFLVVERCGWV